MQASLLMTLQKHPRKMEKAFFKTLWLRGPGNGTGPSCLPVPATGFLSTNGPVPAAGRPTSPGNSRIVYRSSPLGHCIIQCSSGSSLLDLLLYADHQHNYHWLTVHSVTSAEPVFYTSKFCFLFKTSLIIIHASLVNFGPVY